MSVENSNNKQDGLRKRMARQTNTLVMTIIFLIMFYYLVQTLDIHQSSNIIILIAFALVFAFLITKSSKG